MQGVRRSQKVVPRPPSHKRARPASLQETDKMQYEEAADKLHALCARERTEEEDWKLNDNTYYSRIDEDDCMAFIVATVMTICKSLGIPERFSAMNRRGAPDTWKLGVLMLYSFADKSWDNFRRELSGITGVLRLGGLGRAPHKDTMRKFLGRIPESMLDDLIAETARYCGTMDAVDGTGMADSNASAHYLRRILQTTKKLAEKASSGRREQIEAAGKESVTGKETPLSYCCTPVRGYVKTTLAGNVNTLAIMACDVVCDHSADVKRLMPVVESIRGYGFRPVLLLADKGYDAEYVHTDVRRILGCDVIIPARSCEPSRLGHPEQDAAKGFYRKMMKSMWDELRAAYGKRSLVECINSMVKRVFGGRVFSNSEGMKHKEVKSACIGHNLLRMFSLRAIRSPL